MAPEQTSTRSRPAAPKAEPEPRDGRLARRAARGRERAFAAIYRRHHQALYRYCRAILHNHEDAQDALQNTMLQALRALPSSRGELALRPWLFRVAHNESISLLRKRSPQRTLEVDIDALASSAAGPSAAEELIGAEQLRELLADIQSLPEHQRGALLMRELSGLSIGEIAAALEVSDGAAKQLIFEARATLHEFQEGRSMACESVRELIGAGDRRALRARRLRAHLRACESCRAFGESIGARERTLQALFPPLAPAASAALMQRVLARAGAHSGSAASLGAGGASLSAGGLGANHAGFALLAKVLAGALLATGAAVGGATLAGSHASGAGHARAQHSSTARRAATRSRRAPRGGRAPAPARRLASRRRVSGGGALTGSTVRLAPTSHAVAGSSQPAGGPSRAEALAAPTGGAGAAGRAGAQGHRRGGAASPGGRSTHSRAGAQRRAGEGRGAAGSGRGRGAGAGEAGARAGHHGGAAGGRSEASPAGAGAGGGPERAPSGQQPSGESRTRP